MNEMKELQLHQIRVERKNLAKVCSFAVKGLIDRSCFDTMGESSPEVVNFCNIMEHVLSHRLKSRSSWYSQDDRSFWNYIKTVCLPVPHNCIASIRSIEHITTPRGKGRAWLKVVLMEKRLSEYVAIALKQTKITKAAYFDGALMLSDEAQLLRGTLLGLNAIDFSFDLKGENVDLGGLPVIDYTPFLKFQQCPESVHSDTKELNDLSNSNSSSSILSEDVLALDEDSVKANYLKVESKYKAVLEQKGYLEELVRLREDQLEDVHTQRKKLVETLHNIETENRRDRQQLESVIIELQAQLGIAKQEQKQMTKQLKEYLQFKNQRPPLIQEPSMEAIDFREPPRSPRPRSPLRTRAHGETDRLSTASNELSTAHGLADNRSLLSDSRSLLSELSAAGAVHDENSSMIPMAGSFTSLHSSRSPDHVRSNETSQFQIDFVRSVPMTSSVDTKLLSPVAMAVLESNAHDNYHDDDDDYDGLTYYTNHNENKVCVTAEIHRADSLLSPVEDKADVLPKADGKGMTRSNCDSMTNNHQKMNGLTESDNGSCQGGDFEERSVGIGGLNEGEVGIDGSLTENSNGSCQGGGLEVRSADLDGLNENDSVPGIKVGELEHRSVGIVGLNESDSVPANLGKGGDIENRKVGIGGLTESDSVPGKGGLGDLEDKNVCVDEKVDVQDSNQPESEQLKDNEVASRESNNVGQDNEDSFGNSGLLATSNSNCEDEKPESEQMSGANSELSKSVNEDIKADSKQMPADEKLDKNMAEECLADQECLGDFGQPNEGMIDESSGHEPALEPSGKSAEEDHGGVENF